MHQNALHSPLNVENTASVLHAHAPGSKILSKKKGRLPIPWTAPPSIAEVPLFPYFC